MTYISLIGSFQFEAFPFG